MTPSLLRWTEAVTPDCQVLLVVSSAPVQLEEIDRTTAAVLGAVGPDRLSVITPLGLRDRFLHRGVAASRVLVPRVAGQIVEFGAFLERPETVRWALQQRADLLIGTQPSVPRNEDVQHEFERFVAPMVGDGRYVVHSLPAPVVFLLSIDEVSARAGRALAVERHQARVVTMLGALHDAWERLGRPHESGPEEVRDVLGALMTATPSSGRDQDDARRLALHRLVAAARLPVAAPGTPRVYVQPPGTHPGSAWVPARVEPVRRPAQRSARMRWHGTRLVVRGEAEGPYAYLLLSRPRALRRGDAVFASGRVYRGGITIGLVKGDGWASRVDIDEPGAFLASAVAAEPGPHALVVANCLKGEEREVAAVLHRFGWARGER